MSKETRTTLDQQVMIPFQTNPWGMDLKGGKKLGKTRRPEFLKTAGGTAIGATCLMKGISRMRVQEKLHGANKSQEFEPGETVPISGIYDVIHDKLDGADHAQQHQVTAMAGSVFPRCRGCREWVRLRLYRAAVNVEAHLHFES